MWATLGQSHQVGAIKSLPTGKALPLKVDGGGMRGPAGVALSRTAETADRQ